jgi:hypothetical protein
MKRSIILPVLFVLFLSTEAYAESLEVVSIDGNFQHAVLKEVSSGHIWSVKLGDVVSDCRFEGITQNFVTISKLHKGVILLVRLPVPKPASQRNTFNRYPTRDMQSR